MSGIADKICDTICSIFRWGTFPIRREFSDKAQQLRGDIEGNGEAMKRLEILTEEMSVMSSDIRSHEKLLSIASDNLDSPIWGKDIDSRFVFMNAACAEKILKMDVADAMAPPLDDYVPNVLEEVCFKSDKIVQETMKTHRFFEHARFEDGADMWLDTTKSPWVVEGKLVGTVGTGRDITEYVPEDVRERYKESGSTEIDIDIMYNRDNMMEMLGA